MLISYQKKEYNYQVGNLVTFEVLGDITNGAIKYSNGFMETWTDSNRTFKFIIPFKDINYSFIFSKKDIVTLETGTDNGVKLLRKHTHFIELDTTFGGTPKHECRVICHGYWR